MRFVVDASVAIKWILKEAGSSHAREFLTRFRANEDDLIAPDLIVSEVGNALRSAAVVRKRIPRELVSSAFTDFLNIGLPTRRAGPTAPRAVELALQYNATFYDAAYVALALDEAIPILTTDGPMTEKFVGVVEFFKIRLDPPREA